MKSARLFLYTSFALFPCLSHAEIVTDGSLGVATSLTGPDFAITADLGRQRGSNLFHSFSQFNIANGESSTLSGPVDIVNILQRVSGGEMSTIDGVLRSDIAGENMFLMNSAGVMFGSNSSLDLSGSLHITSADYLVLDDATQFLATPLEGEVLSTASPAAFGFLGNSGGSIQLQGTNLTLADRETLTLSGTGIEFRKANVQVSQGSILLASIDGAGEFNIADGSATAANLADIVITNGSTLDVSGEGAGTIHLVGASVYVGDSTLSANTEGALSGGTIDITADDLLFDSSSLSSITQGFGNGGLIDISAVDIEFANGSSIIAGTAIGSAGDSADITLESDQLTFDNSTLSSITRGGGNGGAIEISAGSILFRAGSFVDAGTQGVGNGGAIRISSADDLRFDSSSLSSITQGSGSSGLIDISAVDIEFANGSSIIAGTAIGSTGDSADVILSAANSIQMANTTISLGSLGGGQAGSLTLDAPIITGSLSSSEETIFSSASDTSASINLSGAGAITKVGSNVLTFSGTNTYTGTTTVSDGSLVVNGSLGNTAVTVQSGALLGGSGTLGGSVTVESGGMIAPGNSPGIMTVTGDLNLNSGSITQMEINGTTPGTEYDQIVVGGTATLGGTLNLYFENGLTHDDRFTLIDATAITGDFDSVVNVLNNALTFQTSITDDYILTLTAVQTDFAPFALTPNQLAIANAIDDESLSGNINNLIGELNSLPGSSLPGAFDQIAPTPFAFLPSTAFANTRAQQRSLSNHMGQRRSGLHSQAQSPASTSGFKVQKMMVSSSGMIRTPEENRWGLYTGGNFGRFDLNSGRNGVGYDSDSFGSSVGVDYQFSDSFILGFYTAYQDNDLDFGGNGGDVQSDATTFGLYGSWFNEEGCWVEGSVGAGYHNYDTTRRVLGATATGDTTANEFQISMSTGRDFTFGERNEWTLTPSFGLAYDHLRTDGFTETGSLAPLTMDVQTNSSLQSQAELRLSYEHEWNGIQWLPYFSTGWRHEYLDRSQSVDARFASGGGIFSVNGPSSPRDSITLGTGVNAILSESLSAGIGYNSEVNSSFSVHQIDASLNFKF